MLDLRIERWPFGWVKRGKFSRPFGSVKKECMDHEEHSLLFLQKLIDFKDNLRIERWPFGWVKRGKFSRPFGSVKKECMDHEEDSLLFLQKLIGF